MRITIPAQIAIKGLSVLQLRWKYTNALVEQGKLWAEMWPKRKKKKLNELWRDALKTELGRRGEPC